MRAKDQNGSTVNLGTLITGLIMAGLGAGAAAVVGVAVLAWRADATETDIGILEVRQRVIDRNQIRLDANQRRLLQESEWTQRKLDNIVDAVDAEKATKPPIPKSALEAVE